MNYRNRKLLDLAKQRSCVMCGTDDNTIVSAHSNLQEHGKGMGIKANDCMVAWLCHKCHAEYDQGRQMSKEQRRDFILTAICRTYQEMWNQGLIGVAK